MRRRKTQLARVEITGTAGMRVTVEGRDPRAVAEAALLVLERLRDEVKPTAADARLA
jgi:hypothetical protein